MFRVFVCLLVVTVAFANHQEDFRFSEEELQRYFGVSSHEKAPEYEIVYPEFVTTESVQSIGRSAIAASYLEVRVDAFGQALHMALEHDDSNIRPGLEAEYVTDEGTFTVPVRTDCLYTGKVVGEPDSLVSVTTCAGLMAVMHHASGPTYIEPLDDEHALKRDIGRGLPHVAYKDKVDEGAHCPVTEDSMYVVKSPEISPDDGPAADFNPEATKYLELAFIGDSVLYDLRGTNTHNCLTTLFNAVKNVLQLSSFGGTNLVPKLVYTKVFTSTTTGLKTCPDSTQALNAGCQWQFANNFDKSNSKHWDNAVFLTGWVMDSGEHLGVAWRDTAKTLCEAELAASISTFRELRTTNTVAHEIAHNLGVPHDAVGNSCATKGYIMAEKASTSDAKKDLGWSTCSKDKYNQFVAKATCYDDAN